jgi:hypothetical protein
MTTRAVKIHPFIVAIRIISGPARTCYGKFEAPASSVPDWIRRIWEEKQ